MLRPLLLTFRVPSIAPYEITSIYNPPEDGP
jgi:hypothetical protein